MLVSATIWGPVLVQRVLCFPVHLSQCDLQLSLHTSQGPAETKHQREYVLWQVGPVLQTPTCCHQHFMLFVSNLAEHGNRGSHVQQRTSSLYISSCTILPAAFWQPDICMHQTGNSSCTYF